MMSGIPGEVWSLEDDLAGMSQSDAIREAVKIVGPDAHKVVTYLRQRGFPRIIPQRVYTVTARDRAKTKGTGMSSGESQGWRWPKRVEAARQVWRKGLRAEVPLPSPDEAFVAGYLAALEDAGEERVS